MTRYAAQTTVSTERSIADIKALLARHGSDKFSTDETPGRVAILFGAHGRQFMFVVPLPARDAPEFVRTPARGTERPPAEAYRLWEQACRARYRALVLVIRAKVEAVEGGIETFEDAFFAHTVLPNDGRTLGEVLRPALARAYETLDSTPLLPAPPPETP